MELHPRVISGYVMAVIFLVLAVVANTIVGVIMAVALLALTMGAQWYLARGRTPAEDDLSGVLAAWVQGWALSRRVRVVEVPSGFRVDVRQPDRTMEYVVMDAPDTLEPSIDTVRATPGAWLTVVTQDPGATRVWLVEGGLAVAEHDEALMWIDLGAHPQRDLPEGYKAEVSHAGGVISVAVTCENGETAASGRISVFSGAAVADRVETAPEHRRRGLGAAVMSTLAAEARDAGAARGLLAASADGERLYESLGWAVVARLVIGRSTAKSLPVDG